MYQSDDVAVVVTVSESVVAVSDSAAEVTEKEVEHAETVEDIEVDKAENVAAEAGNDLVDRDDLAWH